MCFTKYEMCKENVFKELFIFLGGTFYNLFNE